MPSPANLLTDFILRQSYAIFPNRSAIRQSAACWTAWAPCPPVRSRRWPA